MTAASAAWARPGPVCGRGGLLTVPSAVAAAPATAESTALTALSAAGAWTTAETAAWPRPVPVCGRCGPLTASPHAVAAPAPAPVETAASAAGVRPAHPRGRCGSHRRARGGGPPTGPGTGSPAVTGPRPRAAAMVGRVAHVPSETTAAPLPERSAAACPVGGRAAFGPVSSTAASPRPVSASGAAGPPDPQRRPPAGPGRRAGFRREPRRPGRGRPPAIPAPAAETTAPHERHHP